MASKYFPRHRFHLCRAGGKERGGPRKRQRKATWGGDMDNVQHVATISKADYEAGLVEEL